MYLRRIPSRLNEYFFGGSRSFRFPRGIRVRICSFPYRPPRRLPRVAAMHRQCNSFDAITVRISRHNLDDVVGLPPNVPDPHVKPNGDRHPEVVSERQQHDHDEQGYCGPARSRGIFARFLRVEIGRDYAGIDAHESDRSQHDEHDEIAFESSVVLRIPVQEDPVVNGVENAVFGTS